MKGLEISVTNSDLVIKQEEKLVKLFVMFKDKKYGTKYIIFVDNFSNHLYYGSPLINDNKMVIMKFRNSKDEELVKEFVWNFLNDKDISNFELIEVPKVSKLEIIDNNLLDVKEEYIEKLNNIFFKVEEITLEENEKKEKKSKTGPILFSLVVLLLLGGGILYLKNNKELIYGKNIYVECRKIYDIKDLNVVSNEIVMLTFSNSQNIRKHEKKIKYLFNDRDEYYEFKEKNLSYKYINESGIEKFDDESLIYTMNINYDLKDDYKLPKDYDELYDYYNKDNYICNNIEK